MVDDKLSAMCDGKSCATLRMSQEMDEGSGKN
jgi:hypothetical protein